MTTIKEEAIMNFVAPVILMTIFILNGKTYMTDATHENVTEAINSCDFIEDCVIQKLKALNYLCREVEITTKKQY